MILEGIVTTVAADGAVNIAPMGPQVDSSMERLLLKPFRTAQTYRNLTAHGEGVFHVTDDVLLLAQAALGVVAPRPPLTPATKVRGYVLGDCCRFYEFCVREIDDGQERVRIEANVVHAGRIRDFFGFNRAKHAVVEAAILATRTGFLPLAEIAAEYQRLAILIEKTGGEQEHRAFDLLREHVARANAEQNGARAET
jgi:uncharacterized protein